jgi:hypothetical protein
MLLHWIQEIVNHMNEDTEVMILTTKITTAL